MIYKIARITDRKGKDRIDGRYPTRVGQICEIYKDSMNIGRCMLIQYLSWPDLKPCRGVLTTSTIRNIEESDSTTFVTTTNSVYINTNCNGCANQNIQKAIDK